MEQATRTAYPGTNGGRQFVTYGFRSRKGRSRDPKLKLAALGGSDHDCPTDDPAGRRRVSRTISKREDQGTTPVGLPEIFLVDDKEEAKKRAKDMARGLGLKTYRVVDKTLRG
jgi:hypothetical protein